MGSADTLTPLGILPVHNVLGEGIIWDSRRQVLLWTDIQGRRLYRYDWKLASTRSRASRGWSAAEVMGCG